MDYRDESKIKFSARYGAEAETIGAAGGHTGDGTDEIGGLVDSIIFQNKENGYTVRAVPVKGEKWGLPYNFEYFFYPYRKR